MQDLFYRYLSSNFFSMTMKRILTVLGLALAGWELYYHHFSNSSDMEERIKDKAEKLKDKAQEWKETVANKSEQAAEEIQNRARRAKDKIKNRFGGIDEDNTVV